MTLSVDWAVYPEQREKIEPHLSRALFYAPTWLQTVSIRYAPEEENLASTSPVPEYRTANVRVGNAWFSETEEEQAVTLIHEVLHAHVEGLAVVFKDLLSAVLPDDDAPLRKWAEEQWRRAEEGAISDLARCIAARERLIP